MSYEQSEREALEAAESHLRPPDEPHPRYSDEPIFGRPPDTPEGYVVCDACDELVPENETSEHACDFDPELF